MRKSIAVMILALLVVSMVPMVFAQDDVRDGSRDRLRMRIDEIRVKVRVSAQLMRVRDLRSAKRICACCAKSA